MTWTPRVGDWLVLSEYQNGETLAVVDGVDHDVGGPRFWLVDTAGEQQGYVTPYNLETFCRPATIDEIPGNTASADAHDVAMLGDLSGGRLGWPALKGAIDAEWHLVGGPQAAGKLVHCTWCLESVATHVELSGGRCAWCTRDGPRETEPGWDFDGDESVW